MEKPIRRLTFIARPPCHREEGDRKSFKSATLYTYRGFENGKSKKQSLTKGPLFIKGTYRREKGRKNLGTSTFFWANGVVEKTTASFVMDLTPTFAFDIPLLFRGQFLTKF